MLTVVPPGSRSTFVAPSRALVLLFAALGASACDAPRNGPPNVLIVSLDTFRADRVGALGNADGLTPNLDRFAAESIVFSHAYSQSTVTGPSHTSVLTSRYPTEFSGATRAATLSKEMYTLPEVLGKYGYQTAARVAGGDLNPALGPTRGFGSYETSVDFGSLWHTLPMATAWLDGLDSAKPFFLLLHGYDTHTVYLKPTPYGLLHTGREGFTRAQEEEINATERVMDGLHHRNLDLLTAVTVSELYPRSVQGKAKLAEMVSDAPVPFPLVPPEDQEVIRKVYDGAVSYADAMFGLMLVRLEERGLLDDTLIVLMGDHGEALGDYGLFHRCCSLEDDVTHVPLMVRLPGGERGGERIEGVVELLDIFPTILERVGAVPPIHMRGQSFGAALRGEPFTGRRAAMTQGGLGARLLSARSLQGRLTYTGIPLTSPDLASVVQAMRIDGPAFEHTAGLADDEALALRTEMVGWLRSLAPPPSEGSAAPIPKSLLRTLRAKGYWDAQ